MARFSWSFDPLTLIPGYGVYRSFKNVFDNFKNEGYQWSDWLGWYGAKQGKSNVTKAVEEASPILGEVLSNSRAQYLEDREHTEQREDSSYQRAVSDMRAAGLNPYTISASPSNSSASTVGENSIASKLQILGYILDLQNLDARNRSITNNAIGTIIKAVI